MAQRGSHGPGEKAPLVPPPTDFGESHGDPYESEMGPGAPVYNAWAIEDDKTSCSMAHHGGDAGWDAAEKPWSSHGSPYTRQHKAQQRTFRTPAGRPSNNELWRFRTRGCQDCWAALFFVALVVVTLLWGLAQVWGLQLTERDLAVIAGDAEWHGYANTPPGAAAHVNSGGAGHGKKLHHGAAVRAGIEALYNRMQAAEATEAESIAPTPTSTSTPSPAARRALLLPAMRAIAWCTIGAVTTILTAYVGLLVIAIYPRQLIFIQSTFASMSFAVMTGLALVLGSPIAALIFAFMTFMPLLWLCLIQDRIPFTTTMLCATVSLLRRHRSIFVISLGSVVMSWVVAVTAALCVVPSVLRLCAGTAVGKDVVYPFIVAFCVFWVLEVLAALVHVTVCGVVATWYFAGEEYMPSKPVEASFRRAVTTSFGSVCLGSLITALVTFVRFCVELVRGSGDRDSFWLCAVDCILGCIEDLVRYFNQYAFVHVAVYGCCYTDGAKETWALVKQCAFSAVFNDALTGQVIGILTLMCALVVAVLTALVTWNGAAAGLMFAMTLLVCGIFYNPVSSCVTTIFVCFAEVPVGLQLSFPELYDALVDADAGYTARRGETAEYGTVLA